MDTTPYSILFYLKQKINGKEVCPLICLFLNIPIICMQHFKPLCDLFTIAKMPELDSAGRIAILTEKIGAIRKRYVC